MTDRSIFLTVPGRPVSLNGTYMRRHGKGKGLMLTPEARAFKTRVQYEASKIRPRLLFDEGHDVAVVVTAYFTRQADSGACTKLIKDAFEGILYTNDRCVVFEASWRGDPDPKNPRTEIGIRTLPRNQQSIMIHRPGPGPCESKSAWEDAWDQK